MFAIALILKLHLLLMSPELISGFDHVFGVERKTVIWFAILSETLTCSLCLTLRNQSAKIAILGWMGVVIAAYRLAFQFLGLSIQCDCFGKAASLLGFSDRAMDQAANLFVMFLIGGAVVLFAIRSRHDKQVTTA